MMTSVRVRRPSLFILIAVVCIGCNPGASPTINKPGSSRGLADSNKLSQDVLSGVRRIVAEALSLRPEEVNVDAPLSKQKNPADELDVVEIVMMVEEAYKVEIKDEQVGGALDHVATNVTVRKLANIVVKQLETR